LATRSISETKRVRYLLGLSFPAEREEIESEFFADDDAFQEMLTTEEDLIDAYARDELSGEEQRRFEKIFVNSLRGRNRVQFARAFAGAVVPHPVETENPRALLDVFKSFQLPRLLSTATIAALIVFVAVIAWLIIDRRRLTNELRELHVEFTELSTQIQALQRSSDSESTRNAEVTAKLIDEQAPHNRPRRRDRRRIANQQAPYSPEVKDDHETIASIKPETPVQPIVSNDATLGNRFESMKITELPLEARKVANLLTLQPVTTHDGVGVRTDQTNVYLDGVELEPRNRGTTIRLPNSQPWIRFQIPLDTGATHEDYLLVIKTADGRPLTSVSWSEPLTPKQTLIDTPVVSTSDLPSGDYLLFLMGKEPDGSFVKVSECTVKVIKY
jgi:hypothetical protein